MEAFRIFSVVGMTLFAIGAYGVMARRRLLPRMIALNIMSGGVFLVLVAVAARDETSEPDPVPHAMVLTGIVVTVCATAFAMALVHRLHRLTGSDRLGGEP